MAEYVTVAGHCPMGCGRTLFLDEEGHVLCSWIRCPDRLAVDTILDNCESEHVVEFRPDTFIVRHPLRERLGGALMTCALHVHIESLSGPPVRPGRYRATPDGSEWTWEPL